MKKLISILLAAVLILSCAGCSTKKTEITCDQVIAVYEEAGYEVFHKETAAEDSPWVCYIQATAPNSEDYIMFHFFDSSEAAESYADTAQWNVILWFYSLASGQPTWVTAETYNNIEIEYDNDELYKPFQTLLK